MATTRIEALLDNVAGAENPIDPATTTEGLLDKMAGGDSDPRIVTRENYFLNEVAENGSGASADGTLEIYDNGTYDVSNYSTINVQTYTLNRVALQIDNQSVDGVTITYSGNEESISVSPGSQFYINPYTKYTAGNDEYITWCYMYLESGSSNTPLVFELKSGSTVLDCIATPIVVATRTAYGLFINMQKVSNGSLTLKITKGAI